MFETLCFLVYGALLVACFWPIIVLLGALYGVIVCGLPALCFHLFGWPTPPVLPPQSR
jgi:hypothetical protein